MPDILCVNMSSLKIVSFQAIDGYSGYFFEENIRIAKLNPPPYSIRHTV